MTKTETPSFLQVKCLEKMELVVSKSKYIEMVRGFM